MGFIKAAIGSFKGTIADQWKEFFYCDSMAPDVLAVKGTKRTSKRSSNTKGSDNIITNGSGIVVADGQCAIIVDQGLVVDFCAVAGEYTYDMSSEPSLFSGSLESSIKETFKTIGKRFTYGGDTGRDQRIYYFNKKEITDNKFGTQNPIPFRVVDRNIGLDVDISVRCNGIFSYKISDPILFYTNVCGNFDGIYTRENIDKQLKSEFLNALQPAFAKISDMGIRYSSLPGHTMELSDAMNEVLSKKWTELRGLSIVSVAINSITALKEDEDMIKQLQRTAVLRDPTMAAASIVGSQADSMRSAASNQASGSMMGFMNMNMATHAGGMNAQSLYQMGAEQRVKQYQQASNSQEKSKDKWTCTCGSVNTGKFCTECGKPKPVESNSWTCTCGSVNKGKFCTECGKSKSSDVPHYRCDKCGWEPKDLKNPPKFCPECGDIFDDADIK